MRLATIFAYLAGRRAAILEVASNRRALIVGALLVLSAALARNYDQASLTNEPWRLLGPFAASLAISGPLFLTIYGIARWKGMESPGIGRAYLSFLGLYWMTAPLAWLYGIPYEAFLSPVEAVRANLWTLALVSAWRVALMVRVVSVVFNIRVRAAVPLVMLVADIAALTALHLIPLPIISVMGGINPANEVVAVNALLVKVVGWLTLGVWVALTAIVAYSSGNVPEWQVPSQSELVGSSHGALIFSALIVAFWAAFLPFTQPAQILARRVERTYRTDGPATALAVMSAHERLDFPHGWQPPPRRFPAEAPTSELLDVLEILADQPHADWVRALYARRFKEQVEYGLFEWPAETLRLHAVRLLAIFTHLPQGRDLAVALLHAEGGLEQSLGPYSEAAPDERAALEALVQLAGKEKEEPPARADRTSP
jgi:hypothetical protein